MAHTRLTKVGPLKALLLCAFAAFAPTRLVEAELADEEVRKHLPQPAPPEPPRAFTINRGLWASLVWVMGSITAGYLAGKTLGIVSGPTPTRLLIVLQVFGAMT